MAEKSEDKCTVEEKISQAKELVSRGTVNYFIDAYADAADDLSHACSIYATLFGQNADELGRPYLLYAKSLIALAQDENKLMEIPEEDEGNEEDGDDQEEDKEENEGDKKSNETESADAGEPKQEAESKELDKPEEIKPESTKSDEQTVSNGHTEKSEVDGSSNVAATTEQKPESSTTNGNDTTTAAAAAAPTNDGPEGDEDEETTKDTDEDDSAASLQVAWEVLELAVKIFEKQGDSALPNLADAHNELANISFENSFFQEAIKDYTKSYEIYLDLPEPNRRILAELQYKIGLCHIMQNDYDNAIKSLKKSCEIFDEEIATEKAKANLTEDVQNTIKNLEETKQEILDKINDVEESKQQSTEEVKRELAKLIAVKNGSGDGPSEAGSSTSSVFGSSTAKVSFGFDGPAGSSSSSSSSTTATTAADANKSKPSDISHLIKRKKPEEKPLDAAAAAASDELGPPPAKKPSL